MPRVRAAPLARAARAASQSTTTKAKAKASKPAAAAAAPKKEAAAAAAAPKGGAIERIDFQLAEAASAQFGCETRINPDGPKSKAFEISVWRKGAEEAELVWSGLKKGPPRRLKFPDLDVFLDLF